MSFLQEKEVKPVAEGQSMEGMLSGVKRPRVLIVDDTPINHLVDVRAA